MRPEQMESDLIGLPSVLHVVKSGVWHTLMYMVLRPTVIPYTCRYALAEV